MDKTVVDNKKKKMSVTKQKEDDHESSVLELNYVRKKKVLILTAIFIIFFLLIYGILAVSNGKYILASFDFLSALLMAISLIVYLKRDIYSISRNIMISIIYFFFLYLFFGEGVELGSYLWTLAFPIYTIFFLESRSGFNVSVLFFLSEVLLYISGIFQVRFQVQFLIRYSGVYIAIVMISYIIEKIREENFSKILKIHSRLEDTIKRLSSAQRELSLSEEKYRSFVERGNDGIVILQDNSIVYSNPQFSRMLGLPEKKLKNSDLKSFIAEEDHLKFGKFFNLKRGNSETQKTLETILIDKDLNKIEVEIKRTSINYMNSESDLLFVRDIRDRKILERERIKFSKTETFRSVSDGITHDFNNLLTIVIGNVELAKLNIGNQKKLRVNLAKIEHTSVRAEKLIKQLLTFSSDAALIMSKEYMQDLLPSILESYKNIKKVKFEVSIHEDLWPVRCDRERLKIALSNIIANSIESIKKKGEISIKIINIEKIVNYEKRLKYGQYIMIEIIDDGKGISGENLGRIFDPYFSTKKNVTQKGMGLGLTISNRVIINHKGIIQVSSKPLKGTVFKIFLPAEPEKI